MYIANIKEIDNITVVLGIGTKKLDPVGTHKKVKPFLEASKEFKIVADKFAKVRELTADNANLKRQGRRIVERVANNKGVSTDKLTEDSFSSLEMESFKNYNVKMENNTKLINSIQTDLLTANANLEKKKVEIMKSKGVYFNIGKNDVEISDITAADYFSKLADMQGKKQFLLLDGEIIPDNRNKTFYSLIDGIWEELKVSALDQKVDDSIYSLLEDLTEDQKTAIELQFENDRINNLTPEEKGTEKNMLIDSVMNRSINLRSKLEIEGDPEALKKSQDLYSSEKSLIEEKYK